MIRGRCFYSNCLGLVGDNSLVEAILVFQINDIVNPLSELIHFVSTVPIDSEASETVTSVDNITEAQYIALIEDINSTPDGNL